MGFISLFLWVSSIYPDTISVIHTEELSTYVKFLSSKELEGRYTGSKGEQRAINYVGLLFSQLNLEPAGDDGQFFQTFVFQVLQTKKRIQSKNLLGRLVLNKNNKKLILIGAHIDHLGKNPRFSSRANKRTREQIHPGADDNASGVSVLIKTAALLKALQQKNLLSGDHDILFAIWSGEELGVLGSTYFVRHFFEKHGKQELHKQLVAVINLDMVGHLRDYLFIQGVASASE